MIERIDLLARHSFQTADGTGPLCARRDPLEHDSFGSLNAQTRPDTAVSGVFGHSFIFLAGQRHAKPFLHGRPHYLLGECRKTPTVEYGSASTSELVSSGLVDLDASQRRTPRVVDACPSSHSCPTVSPCRLLPSPALKTVFAFHCFALLCKRSA